MSGGIAQLVAVGAQDAHLVGQPEVSFFRSNYKRHTNFAQTVERQLSRAPIRERYVYISSSVKWYARLCLYLQMMVRKLKIFASRLGQRYFQSWTSRWWTSHWRTTSQFSHTLHHLFSTN